MARSTRSALRGAREVLLSAQFIPERSEGWRRVGSLRLMSVNAFDEKVIKVKADVAAFLN